MAKFRNGHIFGYNGSKNFSGAILSQIQYTFRILLLRITYWNLFFVGDFKTKNLKVSDRHHLLNISFFFHYIPCFLYLPLRLSAILGFYIFYVFSPLHDPVSPSYKQNSIYSSLRSMKRFKLVAFSPGSPSREG